MNSKCYNSDHLLKKHLATLYSNAHFIKQIISRYFQLAFTETGFCPVSVPGADNGLL